LFAVSIAGSIIVFAKRIVVMKIVLRIAVLAFS
jgi:hypothetical protein